MVVASKYTAMMAGLLFAVLPAAAHASVLEFQFNPGWVAKGMAIDASGSIDVQHAIANIYKIVSATGVVNGSQITGVDTKRAPALFADVSGKLVGENNAAVSFFTLSGIEYDFGFGIATSSSGDVSFGRFDVSSVPLPGAAPMLGLALLSLGGVGYAAKRRKAIAA